MSKLAHLRKILARASSNPAGSTLDGEGSTCPVRALAFLPSRKRMKIHKGPSQFTFPGQGQDAHDMGEGEPGNGSVLT
ncbi:MAG: hypothetical protein A2Z27_03330 [candidate division Zixibacteria bacterium RBG_16_50_21]|nr:MAG: hypothetical protein A2Z27_03330 [candidate division Zixibacteria bacterium RBG_16_50_21]